MSDKSVSLNDLDGILNTLRAILPDLKASYRVKSLGVFGSYARVEQTGRSDLDLLVEFDRTPTIFEFVRLQRLLSAELEVKVDLVMRSALKSDIRKHILREVVQV